MPSRSKSERLRTSVAGGEKVFHVITDENGTPVLVNAEHSSLPPQCQVSLTPHFDPVPGDDVLVSGEDGLYFDRIVRHNGHLVLVHSGWRVGENPSFVLLGKVLSGFEWFRIADPGEQN